MEEAAVTMVFLGAFILIFGIRYLINREKMAMIEKGMHPGIQKATPRPFLSLRFGMFLCGLGIGLMVAMLLVRLMFGSTLTDAEGAQMVFTYFGCVLAFGGLGLIGAYLIEKKWMEEHP